jgi:hypothetical protein
MLSPGDNTVKILHWTQSLSANRLGWMMSELVTMKIPRQRSGYRSSKLHLMKKGISRYRIVYYTSTSESSWVDPQNCNAKFCMLFTQASWVAIQGSQQHMLVCRNLWPGLKWRSKLVNLCKPAQPVNRRNQIESVTPVFWNLSLYLAQHDRQSRWTLWKGCLILAQWTVWW